MIETCCTEGCARPHPGITCWTCSACGVDKGRNGYYWHKSGKDIGKRVGRVCRPCMSRRAMENRTEAHRANARERMRVWRIENPDAARDVKLRATYGLSLDQFNERLAAQGGGCAICGTTDPGKGSFRVDHDHSCCPEKGRSCGRCIRGLLCNRCNVGIGMLGDDPERLRKAAQYVG